MPTTHAPADAVIFQRRNRLKRHFVNTSNVLLYGYQGVSDAAKITYQVIDGFDWESKETGDSKGYVFPAVETLATIRRTTVRTIQRHLKELEAATLLTRQRRRYQPSILFIEEISETEAGRYLAQYVEKPPPSTREREAETSRNDIFVVSRPHPETTKLSLVYKKEHEPQKENEMNVNADKKIRAKEPGSVDTVGAILKRYAPVRSLAQNKPEAVAKRDHLAETLADQLNDRHSLGCYRLLATQIPSAILFETLAQVKEQALAGAIRTCRAALFVDLIKHYAQAHHIVLGFQREGSRGVRLVSYCDPLSSPSRPRPSHSKAIIDPFTEQPTHGTLTSRERPQRALGSQI